MRDKRLFLNTISSLGLEFATIVSGFIVPRLILSHYGSKVNGLVQSITQFLSIIAFLEMGIGSVIRYNLYKPLSNHDDESTSRIVVSATKFFRRIALILLIYTLILMLIYSQFYEEEFNKIYVILLIAVMSISSFSQYYFGQVNQILITSDQKGYIQYFAQIVTIILNTVACIVLIRLDVSIHIVKLSTSSIYLLRPVFLQWYVRKNYNINYTINYTGEPIKQKWNGIAQHISAVVLDNTDVIVLTALSTLVNVSIYSAYYLVINGVKKLMTTATNGIQVKFGHIIACEDVAELQNTFSMTEWIIHTVGTFLFSCTSVLIVPFILVYTKGVTDANYNVPTFALLLTLANMGHTLRLPYSILILASGHYKQTQKNYILAASLNVAVSMVFVSCYGLIGVAIGTIVAMFYQTVWMAYYSYKNIMYRSVMNFWKQLFVDAIIMTVVIVSGSSVNIEPSNYFQWSIIAVGYVCVILVFSLLVNRVLYRKQVFVVANWLKLKIKKGAPVRSL